MTVDQAAVCDTLTRARGALLNRRVGGNHWEGRLSSSALSTATAVLALTLLQQARRGGPGSGEPGRHEHLIRGGLTWLGAHQNPDGGWGDTVSSLSNISTTTLCWAALGLGEVSEAHRAACAAAESWLTHAAGTLTPEALAEAIRRRYGRDRTFSAPILAACALARRLGEDGWRLVPSLPFELATMPRRVFGWLRLPVVSYALPALIAIGQAHHHHRPTSNLVLRWLRRLAQTPTLHVLNDIQPPHGGFLEATPLTSFVVMNLAASGLHDHAVVSRGVSFLAASVRPDGSWPIDTNLATWVTTLSVNGLAAGDGLLAIPMVERRNIRDWLLEQQSRGTHRYTQAAPGAWAWTNLPGGVPDADDTAGALRALKCLSVVDERTVNAARAGVNWLLNLQNRDGGVPTFCRGWGYLPFDRSGADLTAHALQAWVAWWEHCPATQRRITTAIRRAVRYLARVQRADGAWAPLWFGNQLAANEENLTYGTARVVAALEELVRHDVQEARPLATRGIAWLLSAQNSDGGWGGAPGIRSSLEETALALTVLDPRHADDHRMESARTGGLSWLVEHTGCGHEFVASPIGFYFGRLWYTEDLYPLIFTVAALATHGEQRSVRPAPSSRG